MLTGVFSFGTINDCGNGRKGWFSIIASLLVCLCRMGSCLVVSYGWFACCSGLLLWQGMVIQFLLYKHSGPVILRDVYQTIEVGLGLNPMCICTGFCPGL